MIAQNHKRYWFCNPVSKNTLSARKIAEDVQRNTEEKDEIETQWHGFVCTMKQHVQWAARNSVYQSSYFRGKVIFQ